GERKLAKAREDIDRVKVNIGKQFPKEDELHAKRRRAKELEAELSRKVPAGYVQGQEVTLTDGRKFKLLAQIGDELLVEGPGGRTRVDLDKLPSPYKDAAPEEEPQQHSRD